MRGFKSASLWTSYLLGLLWGFLPCGLVLTALIMSMASTNMFQGALTMLIFGLATIPSLFMVRWIANKMTSRIWPRSLASLVMMFFGFQFAMRGFASLGWVGHFMLGSAMFW
jgi:sulfite exporter TauE/SafE